MRAPVLDRYEILGELGQGGMSVVYRARDRQLGRDVAVKVLHEFLARQQDARKRFHREAVACAKLKHPGILEIFDYSGVEAKDSFIVTELIEGDTLRDFIDRRGTPPYPEIGALIVAELVRALCHAHQRSVLHRDLKPENVMITRDGILKLMDFGLAQLMDGGTKLTATGTLLGSPAHMAPEVIDGKPSDARADIFSMGTILYWLCTGKLPFEAPNPSALFKRILDGQYEDPQMVAPRIGNNLARIIHKALAADPKDRYQDVTELLADLEEELQSVGFEGSDAWVRRYLKEPAETTRELGPRLVACLARAGKEALAQGQVARAMDRMNRVLAIDPDHAEVKALVAKIARRRLLAQRLRQLTLAIGTGLILGSAAYAAWVLYPSFARTEPRPARPEPAPTLALARTASAAVSVRALLPDAAPAGEARPDPPVRERPLLGVRSPSRAADPPPRAQPDPSPRVTPPAPAAPDPAPADFPVTFRFGGGYATVLEIDGETAATNVYKRVHRLRAGAHTVTAQGLQGRFTERQLEVSESGEVFELRGGRRLRLPDATLSFLIPGPGARTSTVEGWIWR